jgi:hypothetical protein
MMLRTRSPANEGYLPNIPKRVRLNAAAVAGRVLAWQIASAPGVLNGHNGILRVTLRLTEAFGEASGPSGSSARTRTLRTGRWSESESADPDGEAAP